MVLRYLLELDSVLNVDFFFFNFLQLAHSTWSGLGLSHTQIKDGLLIPRSWLEPCSPGGLQYGHFSVP